MNLENKKVLVIGSGISGIGAAKLLYECGAKPVLYDENIKVNKEDIKSKLPEGMEKKIRIGFLPEEEKSEIALVVPSPGVPANMPLIKEFKKKGIPVFGEIELAYHYAKGKLIAITGTNGKTTTTTLVGQIIEEYFSSVFVVGNIGNPYTEIALKTNENTVTVAEISSFQLETVQDFKPDVSAILNVTPDHLNRHHNMENYVAAKNRVAQNQTKEDVCVLNFDNEYTKEFGKRCPAKVIYFSSEKRLEKGLYLDGEDICLADDSGVIIKVMNIYDMNLVGMCNVENVMAAIGISVSLNIPLENIVNTIKHFKAVEHRIEFVANKKGVDYYNDSKATNPDAAIQGIKAMSKPTILIGGGYDKQSEYDEWIEAFGGKVKCFALIGQTAQKIEDCARKHGITNIIRPGSFEEALKICTEKALPGDAVLLSPACASWGMFPNYEIRGKMFKEYVNNLGE